MMKANKYDWKDSNMALFGSDTEKKVKKESAESEPAWQGAGQEVGVQIWRIEKFQVTHWEKELYGDFYNGDSYIVLNTYKDADDGEVKYDVHFWIGKYSTQDEYGTAAYKTVELDTFLDDLPIQHREVQGHESSKFKSYFNHLTLLKGGAETGFRRVRPEAYKKRLLHVEKRNKEVIVKEIPMKKGNLTSEDVFIIDLGLEIYQWNGSKSNKDEKFKATQYIKELKSARMGKARIEVLEERSCGPTHPVIMSLKDGASKKKEEPPKGEPKMFRLSDSGGELRFEDFGEPSKDNLTSDDVFIINTGSHCYCWIGKHASIDERRNGMAYAHNHLKDTNNPFLPVSVVSQGKESKEFNEAF